MNVSRLAVEIDHYARWSGLVGQSVDHLRDDLLPRWEQRLRTNGLTSVGQPGRPLTPEQVKAQAQLDAMIGQEAKKLSRGAARRQHAGRAHAARDRTDIRVE